MEAALRQFGILGSQIRAGKERWNGEMPNMWTGYQR